MDCQLRLIIYNKNSIYDNFILMPHCVITKINENSKNEKFSDGDLSKHKVLPILLNRKGLNSYLVSAYVFNLRRSYLFRKSALEVLTLFVKKNASFQENKIVFIKLRNPRKHFIDYSWLVLKQIHFKYFKQINFFYK